MTPVAATLATALPEIEPKSADPTTAILAGPPRKRPMVSMAMSVKKREPPLVLRSWPKSRKAMTMVEATASGTPRMPLTSSAR